MGRIILHLAFTKNFEEDEDKIICKKLPDISALHQILVIENMEGSAPANKVFIQFAQDEQSSKCNVKHVPVEDINRKTEENLKLDIARKKIRLLAAKKLKLSKLKMAAPEKSSTGKTDSSIIEVAENTNRSFPPRPTKEDLLARKTLLLINKDLNIEGVVRNQGSHDVDNTSRDFSPPSSKDLQAKKEALVVKKKELLMNQKRKIEECRHKVFELYESYRKQYHVVNEGNQQIEKILKQRNKLEIMLAQASQKLVDARSSSERRILSTYDETRTMINPTDIL